MIKLDDQLPNKACDVLMHLVCSEFTNKPHTISRTSISGANKGRVAYKLVTFYCTYKGELKHCKELRFTEIDASYLVNSNIVIHCLILQQRSI